MTRWKAHVAKNFLNGWKNKRSSTLEKNLEVNAGVTEDKERVY